MVWFIMVHGEGLRRTLYGMMDVTYPSSRELLGFGSAVTPANVRESFIATVEREKLGAFQEACSKLQQSIEQLRNQEDVEPAVEAEYVGLGSSKLQRRSREQRNSISFNNCTTGMSGAGANPTSMRRSVHFNPTLLASHRTKMYQSRVGHLPSSRNSESVGESQRLYDDMDHIFSATTRLEALSAEVHGRQLKKVKRGEVRMRQQVEQENLQERVGLQHDFELETRFLIEAEEDQARAVLRGGRSQPLNRTEAIRRGSAAAQQKLLIIAEDTSKMEEAANREFEAMIQEGMGLFQHCARDLAAKAQRRKDTTVKEES